MLPIELWHMPGRAVLVDFARQVLNAPLVVQSVYLGDDASERQRRIDSLAVFVAAYDYAIAARRDRGVAALAAGPQLLALPPAGDDDAVEHNDDAPALETVLCLRFLNYSIDVDSLDDIDAVDVLRERDWCDYWYSWHAAQLDA